MVPALFSPIQVGAIKLQHRIAMAPMARFRAHESHVHSELAKTYYSQRASTPGTLLITEATFISPTEAASISPASPGFAHSAGLCTSAQLAAWKSIVSGVHSHSSFLFLQLWAMSPPADPLLPLVGHATLRPLSIAEIKEYQKDYVKAAKRFVQEAGGDGVEVHAANGYLPDQFLRGNEELGVEGYGGGVEGRIRFLVELVDELVEAVGAGRVGVKISPFGRVEGMDFSLADTKETFGTLAKTLKARHPNLAYLHAVESRSETNDGEAVPVAGETLDFLFDIWGDSPLLVGGGLTAARAFELTEKHPNAVAVFGRPFTSNPDLPVRIKNRTPLTPYDRSKFYTPGPYTSKGYTDFPFVAASA